MSVPGMPRTAPGAGAAARLAGVRLRRRGGSGDVTESHAPDAPRHATFAADPTPVSPEAGAPAAGLEQVAVEQAGDLSWTPPTWEQVVQEHSARVYRLAYRLTGNRHDAEDLTQEVFVRVFRSLSSYTPGTFEGWLHRITTNLFLDQVRRKQRIRFDALPDDAGDRLAGSDPGPERAWEHNNLDHDVQAALDTLPPEFRAAVVLCDIEGLSYEEIAATLDVKLGTVRSRIHRGRAALRQALAHRRPDVGAGAGESPDGDPAAVAPGGERAL
jgi:RNA polymerase sigma-70 factor (ECF subfamily)